MGVNGSILDPKSKNSEGFLNMSNVLLARFAAIFQVMWTKMLSSINAVNFLSDRFHHFSFVFFDGEERFDTLLSLKYQLSFMRSFSLSKMNPSKLYIGCIHNFQIGFKSTFNARRTRDY